MQISQNGVDKLQIEITNNTLFQGRDYGLAARRRLEEKLLSLDEIKEKLGKALKDMKDLSNIFG